MATMKAIIQQTKTDLMYELKINKTGKKHQFGTIKELTEAFPYPKILTNWHTLSSWDFKKPFNNGIVNIKKKSDEK